MRPLVFVVPGAIDQLTGGYLFDRQVVNGLRALGQVVRVIELAGRFPEPDATDCDAACAELARVPDGSTVIIDGLALLGLQPCLAAHASRLCLLGFIHHPLSLEWGLTQAQAHRLATREAACWRLLRGAVCPSDHTAQALRAAGLAPDRVAVAPPGTLRPAQSVSSRPPTESVRLLCVGTLTPRKGHALLIDALADCADLDWRLTCVGSADRDLECALRLRLQIEQAALQARVDLVGEISLPALREAYASSDVFVLPSYHEGYGMVFAEAMAQGLPIVATHAGAIPALVPDTAGLLVPPGDRAALAAALRRLITDPSGRAKLARGARQAAAVLPDWDGAVRRWAAAVERLAA